MMFLNYSVTVTYFYFSKTCFLKTVENFTISALNCDLKQTWQNLVSHEWDRLSHQSPNGKNPQILMLCSNLPRVEGSWRNGVNACSWHCGTLVKRHPQASEHDKVRSQVNYNHITEFLLISPNQPNSTKIDSLISMDSIQCTSGIITWHRTCFDYCCNVYQIIINSLINRDMNMQQNWNCK